MLGPRLWTSHPFPDGTGSSLSWVVPRQQMGPAAWAQLSQAGESWASVPPPNRTRPAAPGEEAGGRGGQACTLSLWGVSLLPAAGKLQSVRLGYPRRAQHVGRSPARQVTVCGTQSSSWPLAGSASTGSGPDLGPTSKFLLSFRGTEFPGGPEAHPLRLLSRPT